LASELGSRYYTRKVEQVDLHIEKLLRNSSLSNSYGKAFSNGWQLRTNYRYAKLKGNWEGAFRNDNGQSDPNISSLFDFTAGNFGMLGDQFAIGYLNTDRRHVVNGFFSYTFGKYAVKGLTIGTGLHLQSGQPINDLKAHPAYLNGGEIPAHGRGALAAIRQRRRLTCIPITYLA
jgi:hypothetical protein